MIEKHDDMLKYINEYDLIVIPSCSTTHNGVLDMTVGICKNMNRIWEGIDSHFGKRIEKICGSDGEFWFMPHTTLPVALLQTKTHAKHSDMPIVTAEGLSILRKIASYRTDMKIAMVLPSRAIDDNAKAELASMPDNVVRFM
jgi:hypothetical protein